MKCHQPDYTPLVCRLCARCGRPYADPSHLGPGERHQRGKHDFRLRLDDLDSLSAGDWQEWVRMGTKERAGAFDPPLPPPAERRRIRQAAGLTQTDLAVMLGVSDDTVYRWEKAVGYDERGNRLPGREPVGETRRAYAVLLDMAERYGESVEEEWYRRH